MPRQAWAFVWGVGERVGILESPVFFAGNGGVGVPAVPPPALQGGMT